MLRPIKSIWVVALSLFIVCSAGTSAGAQTMTYSSYEITVYDLVNAVNALRAAYGLPAYRINSLLMFTAQGQSDFMAANGVVTHSGPGGTTLTQRLLAAGYPLAGDLSLGGFRAENIIALGGDGSAEDAVNAWMGDAPHQNTMLSPDLMEIGAGVTVANGQVYLVIDCARPLAANGSASVGTQAAGTVAGVGDGGSVVYPVRVNTPDSNGQVIHEVQAGQALWSIAIAYGVTIDELKQLNALVGNDIYPGEKLLIKYEATQTVLPTTETPTAHATETLAAATPTWTPTLAPLTAENSSAVVVPTAGNNRNVLAAIGIVLLAIVGAGIFMSLGGSRQAQ